jgi:nicotinate-nucleotide adenylyltransferase
MTQPKAQSSKPKAQSPKPKAQNPKPKAQIPIPKAETVRLGVLGGTFDPPHYGHLVLAENSRVQLGLERVFFVLAGQPPHKLRCPVASSRHRLAMVEAAVAGNPSFAVSRIDLGRPGPHYTVDMLALLGQEYPAAELFFLMGGDSLAHFITWRDPAGIARRARLAVMQRPGHAPDVETLEGVVPGIAERLAWLDVPRLDIASSDLRRRVREGLPLRYLVPPAVETYICEQRLYGALPG